MSKSRLKYNEAKYFYEQMENNFKERKTEEFKHCINAFLSSARSVTFVLQKEFRKYKGFDEWYELQKEKKFKDEKIIKLVTLRNISLKEEPINPRYVFGVLFEKGVKIEQDDDFIIETDASSYVRHQYKPGKLTPKKVIEENIVNLNKPNIFLNCEFQEIPGVNLFDICKHYLSILDDLVTECEIINSDTSHFLR
jgi:hypothetical protein